MMFPKHKRVRLHGKALAQLVHDVWSRDHEHCIICGAYVPEGTKSHHEPQGADKSDELEKMATLCNDCHTERHFGKRGREIKEQVKNYLRGLYHEYYEHNNF